MRKITKHKVESIRRKFECAANESPRDKICRLIDAGSVDVEEALLSCVQAMSEDDCEHVLKDLALAALEGDCADCEDEVSVEVDDLDDAMPGDDEMEESDMDEEDIDEEDVEKDDADDADESCSKRRQLERRIRRMERLMKNEKGLFDFFRKKKKPAETKLDLQTFQRMGKDFLEKICDNLRYDYKPSGRVEARSTYVACGWMNGAQMVVHFNNGSPSWSMVGSDRAIEKSMPKGNMRVEDGELKFADSKDWNKIRNALKVQSDFTRGENDRRNKQWAKDRAAADAARAKQNRGEDDWFSKRMNPYSTDWL